MSDYLPLNIDIHQSNIDKWKLKLSDETPYSKILTHVSGDNKQEVIKKSVEMLEEIIGQCKETIAKIKDI